METTMIGEPHKHQELAPEELRKLAADVADWIVNGEVPEPRLEELLAARLKCPPKTLCCFNGYKCADFWCEGGFQCTNGHGNVQTATQF
jgi:hypothetical protein